MNSQEIIPINENIILEVDREMEQTKSGVLSAVEKGEKTDSVAIKGTVVCLPEDLTHVEREATATTVTIPRVKLGDTVYVGKWEGQKAFVASKEYLVVKYKDILFILKG